LVPPTLERIAEVVEAEAPHPSAYSGLRRALGAFVSNLLAGEAVGAPAG
jgi:serine/threonine-protein kinase HipA